MQKYFNTVTNNRTGKPVAGASVVVTVTSTGGAAALYSDNGVTSLASNTLTTNHNGYFEFYAADGRYTLRISGAGIESFTITDVLLEDPADDKTGIAAATAKANDAQAAANAADAKAVAALDVAAVADAKAVSAQEKADAAVPADSLSSATGAAMVGFQQGGAGAAARTAQEKLREVVSVLDYYVAGEANHTQAFVRAAAALDTVRVPAGTYDVTPATLSACLFVGDGEGVTILRFTAVNGLNGFTFEQPTVADATFGFTNLSIVVAASGGLTCIKGPVGDGAYYDLRPKMIVRDVTFAGTGLATPLDTSHGTSQDYGWQTYIEVGDGWTHDISNVAAIGTYKQELDPATQSASKFIRLNAQTAMVSARIDNIQTMHIRDGIEIGDYSGVFISRVDIARAERGIFTTGTKQFGEGRISDCVINAQKAPVYISSLGNTLPYGEYRWIALDNIACIRSPDGYDAAIEWVGCKIENVKRAWITNLRVDCTKSSFPLATAVKGLIVKSCEGIHADGAKFASGMDVCVETDGTNGFTYDNFEFLIGLKWFEFKNNSAIGRIGQHTGLGTLPALANRYAFTASSEDDVQIYQRFIRPGGTAPSYQARKSDGLADEKHWESLIGAAKLTRQILSDDLATATPYHVVNRSGTTVTSQVFTGNQFDVQCADGVSRVWRPASDNAFTLGTALRRWSVVHAGTGTISTSDEREKQQIKPIDEAALRAWAKVQFCQFKFNDAAELKGDGARWHFGVIAQRVKEAFESEGLDPFAYGVLCYDEWAEQPEEKDEDGNITQAYQPAANRYGIRYEEALVLECAYLRSRLQ